MDDDYGGQIEDDAALAAAMEAAERAHATNTAPPQIGFSSNIPSSVLAVQAPIVGQPVPQKIGRGGSASSIIVNARQVCAPSSIPSPLLRGWLNLGVSFELYRKGTPS